MMHESGAMLCRCTFAVSIATGLVLILRQPARHWFGARVSYLLWTMVPLATFSIALPARPLQAPIALPAMFASVPAFMPTMQQPGMVDVVPWLVGAWLAGTLAFALMLVDRQRCFVRRLGQLQPACDGWSAEFAACGPVLVGAWHPRLILPADFQTRYNAAERTLILAHERAHLAHGDAQVNLLVAALRCLQWFNPFVHFAVSRFRLDQELACDAIVIARFPQARRSYAEAMLKTQLVDSGLPVGCHWQPSQPLQERIAMLKQPLPGPARAVLGFTFATALVAAGSYAAWAAQPVGASVPPASADARSMIRGDITLRIAGGAPHSVAILSPAGVPFAVADGEGPRRWELQGTATLLGDGKIAVDAVVKHGEEIVGRPRLITEEGKSASIRLDDAAHANIYEVAFILTRVGAKDGRTQ
jgi:bla regulator protein blaR1